jgi:hypothetical protein
MTLFYLTCQGGIKWLSTCKSLEIIYIKHDAYSSQRIKLLVMPKEKENKDKGIKINVYS